MKYQLFVKLSDEDYLEFNRYAQFLTPEGKKVIRLTRVLILMIFALTIYLFLLLEGFTLLTWITVGFLAIALGVFQLLLKPYFRKTLGWRIQKLKKSGKKLYSPEANLEFYDDYFVEMAEGNRSERKYATIDRVSIVEGKGIYIHENPTSAYIIPYSTFSSQEEYWQFREFVKSSFPVINRY